MSSKKSTTQQPASSTTVSRKAKDNQALLSSGRTESPKKPGKVQSQAPKAKSVPGTIQKAPAKAEKPLNPSLIASKAEDANPYGIHNSRGVLTSKYLVRYVQYYLSPASKYSHNRKENMAYFVSAEFLSQFKDQDVRVVWKAAQQSPRWNPEAKPKKVSRPKAKAPAAEPTPETPVEAPNEVAAETTAE